MKVLLTGARGQLGSLLRRSAPAHVELLATDSQQLDIGDAGAVLETCRSFQPDVVINAAAYTQVDKAESEAGLAMAINHQGVLNLIAATEPARRQPEASDAPAPAFGALRPSLPTQLIHISTDFVFDGSATRPYRVDDPVSPLGSYGRSKLAGEQALQQLAPQRSCIIRTAWLYADEGKNFLNTMLHLMATRAELKVVNDQRGTPTSAHGLAEVIWRFVGRFVGHPLQQHMGHPPEEHMGHPPHGQHMGHPPQQHEHKHIGHPRQEQPMGHPSQPEHMGHPPQPEHMGHPLHGIYHWTDSGEATWYEFATEIQRLALQHGLLERAIPIVPITTADYPTPARRPAYSVLDKQSTWAALGVQGSAWQTELDRVLALKKRRQLNEQHG